MPLHQFVKSIALTCLAFVAILASACSYGNGTDGKHDSETLAILNRLDSVISLRNSYIAGKEQRLDSLKRQLSSADDEHKYSLQDKIYSEYYSYDLDSAALYASRKADQAVKLGSAERRAVSKLNLARILLSQGHTHEAVAEMQSVLPDTLFPTVKTMWLDFMIAKESAAGRSTVRWHERLGASLEPSSPQWIYNQSNLLRHKGNFREAVDVIQSNRHRLSGYPHNEAIANYLLGKAYLLQRDTLSAIKSIAASAVNDIATPVRDYKSLYELASLLLSGGDVERAYRYINLAVEDANSTKVFDNMVAVNGIMPQIVKAHEEQSLRQRNAQTWYAAGISVLSICLVAALMLTIRSRNAAGKAAAREKELNAKLREINRELELLNGRISESNNVKDAYLVQYFNLCSYFVGRFEEFRGNVAVTARTKGLAGVEKLLAAADDDRELKKFYSNFDSTFLSLFPDFIARLNALLADGHSVALNRDGSMPNELRTFALIRLGVNDSEQIARFLRRSVSTIYNYRVKMRNASKGPRDEFEAKVREIKP